MLTIYVSNGRETRLADAIEPEWLRPKSGYFVWVDLQCPTEDDARILVVGDERRQRGALALYVTSGWDVQFATDLDGTVEALRGLTLDAVIAEHDAADDRWPPVLSEARRMQPSARRIVRGSKNGPVPEAPLVHRFVDRDAGIDALLDALTADMHF